MKHLIFDFNGPIINADNFYEDRSKRVAKIFEAKWTPRFQEIWQAYYILLSIGEMNIKEYYNKVAESLEMKVIGKRTEWHIEEDRLFIQGERLADDNLPHYLTKLRENYPKMKIGLLSNYVQHWVTETLDNHNIRKYFDVVVISDRMHIRKRDLKIYKLTADVMGVPAYDCGYIGDTIEDLESSRRIAMKPIFIPGEETDPKNFPMIKNIGEIEQYLHYEASNKEASAQRYLNSII